MTGFKAAAVGMVLCAMTAPILLVAQESDLPKADQVFSWYIEATGGIKAYDKIQNRITKAEFSIPAQGVTLNTTVYSTRPNKSYTIMESPALGSIERGCDGSVVWENNPMQGPSVKEGAERLMMLNLNQFERLVYWKDTFKEIKCVGVEDVNGSPAYKVEATPEGLSPEAYYFDKDSHLLVKATMEAETAYGTIPVESYTGEYKEMDGIMIAFKTRILQMGQEVVSTVKSVEHNVEMPKDRFALPDEIKALLEKE